MRILIALITAVILLTIQPVASQSIDADIVVDVNGSGDFTTIQAAIDAAPSNNSTATVIYIKRGLYNQEKLIVPANKTNITLIGESRDETIISYGVHNCNDGGDGLCPDDKVALWSGDNIRTAATLTVMANDFHAENLTIENTAGPVGQAQAITVRGDRSVWINCNLTGYQDTVYLWLNEYSYRAYFEGCMILGRTDYIYGHGIGYFKDCEIRSYGGGWITAPATAEIQNYGFVFYNCNVTYDNDSPAPSDNGGLVRLGRPWHNYPKVAWLYCDMSEKIHSEGWGDKWNMEYSDTDTRLHLYEYQNTGAGADMSGRADWAGLRAMTDEEAPSYEPDVVLAGSDDWNPAADAPLVKTYNWTGSTNTNWKESTNWDPSGVPTTGESATVDGVYTLNADGGVFEADLNMINGAVLELSGSSEVVLLSLNKATISASEANVQLSGTVKTKDTIYFNLDKKLVFNANLLGVHKVIKQGTDTCSLTIENSGFSGEWLIHEGILHAVVSSSLGNASDVLVNDGGTLIIDHASAFAPTTSLNTAAGASLVLNHDITISEWYIGDVLQGLGSYNATTNPEIISGTGQIIVGRPSTFQFIGGANGNWENPDHYSPALLPEAGETVIVKSEIEATSTDMYPNFIIESGNIRLRSQSSKSHGTITMHQNTSISYATSGTGFTLDAPIILAGDITLAMNSSNTVGNIMNLPGTFSGDAKVSVSFTRTGAPYTATVDLGGDNSEFTGIWNLTQASATSGAITSINGKVENAFGKGKIDLAVNNQAVFNHAKCAGDTLELQISGTAKAVLNVDVSLNELILNGEKLMINKAYGSVDYPDFILGEGMFIVGDTTIAPQDPEGDEEEQPEEEEEEEEEDVLSNEVTFSPAIYLMEGSLHVVGKSHEVSMFTLSGKRIVFESTESVLNISHLPQGVYVIKYEIDGQVGSAKFLIN